jgi:hypothetical protein
LRWYPLLTDKQTSLERIDALAQNAVEAVFNRITDLYGHWAYFPPDLTEDRLGRAAFCRWACQVAFVEALRLLPEWEGVLPWFNCLDLEDRRLLLWAYIDQFDAQQFARLLNMPAEMARTAVWSAYRALCKLLRDNHRGSPSDDMTFPRPPILVGLVDPNRQEMKQ